MDELIKDAFRGFGDRMKNLAVYQSIFSLSNKGKYKEIDLVSLGFATLLFMLENMLRNKATTTENLVHFFQQVLYETQQIHLTTEEATELTGVLVDEYLRRNGRKHEFHFFNYEDKKEERILYDLIVYDDDQSINDIRNNKLRKIKLSPLGVELLFKTKEMFNELQVSISQLYFKQQMLKGLFDEAMQAVKDLSLSIKNERAKMKELQSEIIRDAIAVSKRKDLEEQLRRYSEKMEREKEVFNDLKNVVIKTLDEYYKGALTEKEQEGLTLILSIQRELLNVIGLHEALFTEKQRLQASMGDSLESIILNAFSVKLNFEKDVLSEVVQRKTSLDSVHQIVNPILPIKKFSLYNPASSFLEQKKPIKKKERDEIIYEPSEEEILKAEMEEELAERKNEERQLRYLRILLTPLLYKEEVLFSDIVNEMKGKDKLNYLNLMDEIEFYYFMINLHQTEYTAFQPIKKELYPHVSTMARLLSRLIEENSDFEDIGCFSITPLEEIVSLPIAEVTNYKIQRGNNYVVAKK